jgi:hypothetical protein
MTVARSARTARMKDEKLGRKTSPGFGDPRAAVRPPAQSPVATRAPVRVGPSNPPVRAAQTQPPSSLMPQRERSSTAPVARTDGGPSAPPQPGQRSRPARGKPIVEVEVLRERARTPRPRADEGCYEVWTQNHVYALDARMRCVQVRTPHTGEVRADHPFLGGRLVGGQAQDNALEMSHPLPRPGAFAVFELRKKNRRQFVRTSPVDRMVLRLRVVTIADGAEVPSWEEVVDDDDE